VENTDPSAPSIYWLNGVAGTGKTTIARSVAHGASEKKQLGASFFFSRSAADRRHIAAVIPTIVYQIAISNPSLRGLICDAIESDPDVRDKALSVQSKVLLSETLKGYSSASPMTMLIVLDALDECDKDNGREGGDLIPILLRCTSLLSFRVKIFITSRPELPIQNMFSQPSIRGPTFKLVLHSDIETHIVQADIRHYLQHHFHELSVARLHGIIFPSEETLEELVSKADTLFIYAATILRYISDEDEDPVMQLKHIMENKSDERPYQYKLLDDLYLQILLKASETSGNSIKHTFSLRQVLSVIVLAQDPLLPSSVAVLANIEEVRVATILKRLSSLLIFNVAAPVRLFHPSFPDFITDSGRCLNGNFLVVPHEGHSQLAVRCLELMVASLKEDICDIKDPTLLNSEVPQLAERVSRSISPELRYACMFWHIHIRLAVDESPALFEALSEFCKNSVLYWLETLSLTGQLATAEQGLPLLIKFLRVRYSILVTSPSNA
jgi:hypothetical protein